MGWSKGSLAVLGRIAEGLKRPSLSVFKLMAFLFFLCLCLIKMRVYLFEGRFWAEEGRDFYPAMLKRSFAESLIFLFNGHLELLTNLIVALATQVRLELAPLVTVYLSLLVQLIPIAYLISYFPSFGLSRMRLIFFLLFVVALPQSLEVWANSINLHFHMALLVGLMIANTTPITKTQKWLHRVLYAIAGLSGIPANFLTPIAIIRAWQSREMERWVHAMILTTTTLFQGGLLLIMGLTTAARSFTLRPLTYWFTLLFQQFLGPILGSSLGNGLGRYLREGLRLNGSSVLIGLILTLIFTKLLHKAYDRELRVQGWLWISSLILSVLSVFTALGDPIKMISATGNGRYFFASNVLLYLGLLARRIRYSQWIHLGVFVITLSCLIRLASVQSGPSWRKQIQNARDSHACELQIWPNGWTMVLDCSTQKPLTERPF